ncbi:hypothetical protein GCM10017687_84060 [Streptomyces echinatus]
MGAGGTVGGCAGLFLLATQCAAATGPWHGRTRPCLVRNRLRRLYHSHFWLCTTCHPVQRIAPALDFSGMVLLAGIPVLGRSWHDALTTAIGSPSSSPSYNLRLVSATIARAR